MAELDIFSGERVNPEEAEREERESEGEEKRLEQFGREGQSKNLSTFGKKAYSFWIVRIS